MDLIGPLVALGALTWVEWKHAPLTRAANHLATLGRKGSAWITDERGAYAPLSPQLRYRDFYAADGIVETADGYLWTGGEVLLPSTDCACPTPTSTPSANNSTSATPDCRSARGCKPSTA